MENINIAVMIGEKFQCESCDYICSAKGSLKIHVKQVHLKLQDNECTVCDYKCSIKSDLTKHIKRIHLKLKDYECKQCDHKCTSNGNLQSHVKRVHLKLNEFECKQCDYKCALNSELKQHAKAVHLKLKDIKCQQCDYKCSSNGSLKIHVKAVHLKLKNVACQQCEYKCSTNGSLKQHVKYIHDNPKTKNMSRGEASIFNYLLETGYEFNKTFFREVTFNDLRGVGDGLLRYDFKVMIDDVIFVLIEFDGGQHFKPVKFTTVTTAEEALANYKLSRTHDRIKNDYCSDNGIALLRIKYDQALLIGVMITEFIRIHS